MKDAVPPTARQVDLICFDVDGTLVEHPKNQVVWEVLNLRFGGSRETNRQRWDDFQAGKISYSRWVELDVGDWISAGARRDDLVDALGELRLIEGARETLEELRSRGYALGVISGTLDIVLDTLFPDHPFEEVFTNRLHFDPDGRITDWEATPYDLMGKPDALREIAGRRGVPLERCAFVGDNFNDVDVCRVCGFSVALNPKSVQLVAVADLSLRTGDLRDLLPHFP